MRNRFFSGVWILFFIFNSNALSQQNNPLGNPGECVTFDIVKTGELPGSVVKTLEMGLGKTIEIDGLPHQWLYLECTKVNGQQFMVWLLCSSYPSKKAEQAQLSVARYILKEGDGTAVEFSHNKTFAAILPSTGAWEHLLPRNANGGESIFPLPKTVHYLGLKYQRQNFGNKTSIDIPPNPHIIELSPDRLAGVPHNTRLKDGTRRYDESDYEYIRLTKADYMEMIEAGFNCFRVDAEQLKWIENSNVYFWGIGGDDVAYPECLYKSSYIGPSLFFDEPMVGTRDRVVKPKLQKDPELRKSLTPQKVLQDFKELYHETKYEHGSISLLKGLAARKDVDIGDMDFLQQNMYTWETMPSSALYQLSEGNSKPPYAMVFETPGRFGYRRILPELNMCFDCQIPVNSPKNLTAMIYGFLRGAARVTDREWGVSIYGAVDRTDSFWMFNNAYDLGASLYFFWDTYQLAAVPYEEYMAITRNLKAHAQNNPKRNLQQLKQAGEVALLLPPGYNLGHVHMGRGVFSAIPELNMERSNSFGVTYRQVMNNFYIEIERCLRLGIEFDLFWNLENLKLPDYREVVTIREDGKLDVLKDGKTVLLDRARIPNRPEGSPPELVVETKVIGHNIIASAEVKETTAPIFYTPGADKNGIHNNQYVLWEIFGPEEEDYSNLWTESWNVKVSESATAHLVEINFTVPKPGTYRLRAATADVAGRSKVLWKEISVVE
jgi:hypothetical protein